MNKTTGFEQQLEEIKNAGRKRDYRNAILLCTELLSQTDRYPEALLYLGRSYHALKEYDRALSAFQFYLSYKPDSAVGRFFLGRTFAALGLHKKAIPELEAVLKREPGFVPALSFLGISWLKLKKPDAAIPFFEQALKAEPNNRRVHNAYLNALLIQGIRLFYRKDMEGAARIFEFLIQERQGNILPLLYLAVIARELDNFTLALLYYDEALKISPDDPVFHLHKAYLLLKMGKNQEALSELKHAKNIFKEDMPGLSDPERLLKLIAVTHYRHKRFRQAVYFGKQVLKNNYRDPDMHMLLAECYRAFGDLLKAKNHYTRAMEAEPRRLEIYYGLAVVLWEMKRHKELDALTRRMERLTPGDSMAAYFKALCMGELGTPPETLIPLLQEQIHKQGPDPHLMFSLGREYARSGRPDLAVSWLVRTHTLVPDHAEALLLLDSVYETLGRSNDEIGILKEYCDRFPEDVRLRKKYARLLIIADRYREAAGALEKLITLEPSNVNLKKTLGLAYLKSKRYGDAIIVFKELITREPKSVFALRELVFCLVKIRKRDVARLILEKAIRYIKNEPDLLLPLGVLYGRGKEYEKATEIFRRVAGINPQDWRAFHNLAMVYRRMGNKAMAETFLQRAREKTATASTPKTAKKNSGR